MIRKLLAAVAVLGLAGTGAVAQGVSFSGSGNLGMKYAGDTKNEDGNITMESHFQWISNFDLAMSASGTTDGGLTFGAGATIKAGNGDNDGSDGDKSGVGASNAYIGGESWKISIGDLDPASHKGRSLNDVGFDGLDVDDVAEDAVASTDADVEVSFNLGAASLAITAGTTPGAAGVDNNSDGDFTDEGDSKAEKQKSVWAAGVSFDIGSTNLGLGMDSEKLLQASISADLGAFSGSLFYAQQKADGPMDNNGTANDDTDDAGDTLTNKKTGLGVEVSVSAGANTTINAVYTQGKQSDTRDYYNDSASAESTDGDREGDAVEQTDKGFGVGVSHSLGGGATLEAGFAKVKKQTKFSVGVSMSF